MNINAKKNIPLFNAQRVNENYNFLDAAERVLKSWWYILGEEVANFESEYADYLKVRHCVSVANGTEALEIALKSVGVAQGDIVAVVANGGFYSSTAVYAVGSNPIYVDIDPDSLTMSSKSFSETLEYKPKAVIITHLYGQLAPEIEEIVDIAKKHNIKVIEDCAQAHGARFNGKQAGTFGDIACFSFYPTKNLGALGDGGAITTNEDSYAVNARQLRQYGWSHKYHVDRQGGTNSRLDELQAAFLRVKLPKLDDANQLRRNIAKKYNEAFNKLPLIIPGRVDESFVAHLYVIRTERRNELALYLKEHGIGCDIHYPVADHMQTGFKPQFKCDNLSITEAACATTLTLPCYPGLPDSDIDYIIATICEFFSEGQ